MFDKPLTPLLAQPFLSDHASNVPEVQPNFTSTSSSPHAADTHQRESHGWLSPLAVRSF